VSGSVGSAPTNSSRKGGIPGIELRMIVAPFPTTVISEAIAGSPEGPYQEA
jgi:hypothetical protein